MLHNTLFPLFLRIFNADLELWEETRLGSTVSPLSVEAMNLILKGDGILAYIGSRAEFGDYLQTRNKETAAGSTRCWTSLPSHTILGILGLCRHTVESGRSEVIFYGSPLTWALTVILALPSEYDWSHHLLSKKELQTIHGAWPCITGQTNMYFYVPHMGEVGGYQLCNEGDKYLTDLELHEASSLIEGTK